MSEKPAKNRRSLLLIGALCLAPVVGSYIAYYFAPPARHINYGELLNAPPLPDANLKLVDGSPFSLSRLRGKWVLLMTDAAQCLEPCQRKLFTIRQLRLTQGKEMDRIERVWLISDDAPLDSKLAENFPGTWFVRAGAGDVVKRLPAGRAVDDYLYLIDPLGNVVLRYPRDAEPGGIIKDLSRLLKTSRIG
ncbi:MAG: transrane protein [Betaproteobacteria bacterium]|nr:transrane protein [Betaproteobacteria bacterium]